MFRSHKTPIFLPLLLVALMAGNITSSSPVEAQEPSSYTIEDLGTTGGDRGEAWAINDAGQIAGWSYNAQGDPSGFLWQNGAITELPAFGSESQAYGLNESGLIVGSAITGEDRHAVTWRDGVLTDIGVTAAGRSEAYAVNDSGVIAGKARMANGDSHAVIFTSAGITDLGTLGGETSVANAINEQGIIAGMAVATDGSQRAVMWQDGVITDLGTLGGLNAEAYAINDAGQIVGVSQLPDGANHATLWQNGEIIDLGDFNGQETEARGINNSGVIVGNAMMPENGIAAISWVDGQIVELPTPGGKRNRAFAINNNGEIAGASQVAGEGSQPAKWTPDSAALIPATPNAASTASATSDATAAALADAAACTVVTFDAPCAVDVLTSASNADPGNGQLRTALYDAYLDLGVYWEEAESIDDARAAYADAGLLNPFAPAAKKRLVTLEPYESILYGDGMWDYQRSFATGPGQDTFTYFENDTLALEADPTGISIYTIYEGTPAAANIAISLDVNFAEGASPAAELFWGGQDDGSFFTADISPDGGWRMDYFNPTTNEWEEVLGWSGSPLPGDEVHLELRVTGTLFELFINGESVAVGNDGRYLPGVAGFGGGSFATSGEIAKIIFDNARLFELSSLAA